MIAVCRRIARLFRKIPLLQRAIDTWSQAHAGQTPHARPHDLEAEVAGLLANHADKLTVELSSRRA
jgi:hypothetical protein